MQLQGGAAVDEVMESPERRFYVSIQVDWDNDGSWDHPLAYLNDYVESVSVDRSLSGSAPSEIMLIEGSAAAEMTITIGGEVDGIPMAGVFSPYNSKSPLYGREIVGANLVFHIGVETRSGTFWYDQFRGNIRTVSPHRADATVEITALDRVEKLRKAVQLPPWAASEEHILHGELDSQLARSQWVIDNCLRMCDTGAGRKRPPYRWELWGEPGDQEGPQFFLSGNGSYLPTIGWVDNLNASSFPNAGEPMYVQTGPVHPDAPEGAPRTLAIAGTDVPLENNAPDWSPGDYEGILRYWAADRDGIHPVATHYLGLTINTNGPDARLFERVGYHTALEVMVGFGVAIHIDIEEGRARTRYHNHRTQDEAVGSWIDLPTDQEHVDIFALWDFTDPDQFTGVRCYIEADGTNTGWEQQSNEQPGLGRVDQIAGRVTIGNALSVSDVFYANRNFYDAILSPDEAWRVPRYEAVLDSGKNQLSYIPSHKPREAWEIIKEVAAAEMGSVFWDEHGIFRFWNMDTVLAKQRDIVRTLSLDHVSDLAITNSLDSVRNVYNAEVRKRRAVGGLVVFEGSDPNEFMVPARSTRHFRVWVDDALSPLTFFIPTHVSEEGHFQPYWDDNVTHGMCVQYLLNGQWQEDPTKEGLNNVNAYFAMDGSLNIRIQNLWYDDVRLASGLGENSRGALRIAGTKIVSGAAGTLTTYSPGSIEKYGARSMELSGDWWQDTVQSLGLIGELQRRTEAPIPTTDAIEIAGDPRLQLGDMLRLVDPNGLGDEVRVQILGINRSFDRDQGLRDSLTVEMVNPAGRPPVVTAMQDFVTDTTSTVVLTANWNIYNAPSYSAVWEIIDGPAFVGDSLPDVGNGVTFQPAVEGVYVIQITVSTAFGDASDTVSVNSIEQDEDPPDDVMPANPGEALWIGPGDGKNHYNVGIGQPGGGGNHEDFSQEEIEDGFDDPPWFTLTENGDVQFRMNVEYGRTSERTKYPRSELREFDDEGNRAAWDSGSGMHYMEATSRVMRVAPSGDKPEVCFFQVHDEDSDLARVITTDGGGGAEGLRLKILWSPPGGDREEQEQIVLSSYDLGQWIDWRMEFEDGTGRVYLDGSLVWEQSGMGIDGCYFKTGCYNQVNNNDDGGNADEGDYCAVEIAKGSLITWHTGYPDPTVPDFSGGGDNEDDGARSFRFYLTNTAAENPTALVADWWNDSTAAESPRQLGTGPAGSTDSRVITEAVTDSPYYAMMGRWVSSPAPEAGTLYADPWRVTMGIFENDSDADAYPFVTIWITDGDTDTVKGGEAVISRVVENYEIPHDSNRASDFWATGDNAGGTGVDEGELAFAAGDRIVVDVGAQIENTSSDPYSVTAHYGGTSSTDLSNGDRDFNRPAWIDLRMLGGGFESSGGGIGDGGDTDDGVTAAETHGWGTPLDVSDEFDYTGNVDESKWSLPGEYGEGWPGHNENGRRMPDRSTVVDGKLVMTGLANGDTGWLRHRYDSQDGGRWEARVRSFMGAPSAGEPDDTSNGNTYNALLLIWPESNERELDGEYDFMELGDPGQNSMEAYIHYPHPGTSEVQQEHHELSGVDMSEWHNVALEYKRGDDGYVRGYIDGEMWFEDSGGSNDVRRDIQDMPAGHLNIQLDNFHGEDMTPGTIEVQWVRAYDFDTGNDGGGDDDDDDPPSGDVPGDVYDLSRWHITLPTEDEGDGDAEQIDQPELDTYEDPDFFYVDEQGRMVFVAPVNGYTTSGESGSTRTELREHESDYDNSAWNPETTDLRQLTVTTQVDATNVSGGSEPRQEMIIYQIHGEDGTPPFYLAAEYHVSTPRIRLFVGDPSDERANPVEGITPDTHITIRCRVENGTVDLWVIEGQVEDLPSTPTFSWPATHFADRPNWYFKVGAYNKTKIESGSTGEVVAKVSHLELIQP